MAAQGFDRCEFLLELGCGPGEHVVELAKRWDEPFFQPTDCSRAAITSTDLRAREAGLRATRICPSRVVDVAEDEWPQVEGDPPYDGYRCKRDAYHGEACDSFVRAALRPEFEAWRFAWTVRHLDL